MAPVKMMSHKTTMRIPTAVLLAIIVIAGCCFETATANNVSTTPKASGDGEEDSTQAASSLAMSGLLFCTTIIVSVANYIR